MLNRIFPLYLLCLVLFTGCEDFFETTIDLDPPPYEKGMTAKGQIIGGDSVIFIRITEALSAFSLDTFPSLPNADVTIRINDQPFVASFQTEMEGIRDGFRAELPAVLKANDFIQIDVSHPGFPNIHIEDRIPDLPEPSSYNLALNGGSSADGDNISRMNFSMEDAQNAEELYFRLGIVYSQTLSFCVKYVNGVCDSLETRTYTQFTGMDISDPNAVDGSTGSLLRQVSVSGQKTYSATIPQYILRSGNTQSNGYADVLFETMSRNTYLYDISLGQYYSNKENPFATPVNVVSNVSNGYGMVLFLNQSKVQVPIQQ